MKQYLQLSYLLITVAYIPIHLAGGLFGNYLNQLAAPAVFIWPPIGCAVALLLLFGYRYWPAIFLGAIIQAIVAGATSPSIYFFAIGSTAGPLVTTYILKEFINFDNKMDKVRDVLGFIFIALPISSIIVTTIVTAARVLNHTVPLQAYPIVWINIWISDLLSTIIVATPIILWISHPLTLNFNFKRMLETIGLTLSVVFLSVFVFSSWIKQAGPETYLVFFPVIWAALRYGPRETMTIVFIFCTLAVKATTQGFGAFIVNGSAENFIYLRSFMLIFAITSLILATAIYERKQFEKRKNSFIEIASHELKTPLTSLKMITQLMRKDAKKETAQQFVVMDEQIDKLTTLTRSFLDLSRIQADKFKLRKEYILLQEIIDSAINTFKYTEKTHKIITPTGLKIKVYADKERISQVLINLLTNAIKHSPQATKVIVGIERKGGFVQVSVQDFGVGISKEKLKRIFERFYQISEGNKLEGMGLGLFISSEIIKQHNGKIWAISEEKKGSTFFFTLPISKKKDLEE